MRVFIDRGKKPPKEGKNAHVVLSVFTHITIKICQQIPLVIVSVFTHIATKICQQPRSE